MRKELVSLYAAFVVATSPHVARAQETPLPISIEIVDDRPTPAQPTYQIEFRTRNDNWDQDNTAGWDQDYETMLYEMLANLPPSLTTILVEEKTRFDLVRGPSGYCTCGPIKVGIDVIGLRRDQFNPQNREEAFEDLTHELIHRNMPMIPTNERINLDDPKSYTSPWFDEIDEILGGDFAKIRHEIHNRILDLYNQLDPEEKIIYQNFLDGIIYGVGYHSEAIQKNPLYFDHPIEFIPVLGQHYIVGKDHFLQMTGLVFGEEIANRLYGFEKERFDGWEYDDYRPIRRPLNDESMTVII